MLIIAEHNEINGPKDLFYRALKKTAFFQGLLTGQK